MTQKKKAGCARTRTGQLNYHHFNCNVTKPTVTRDITVFQFANGFMSLHAFLEAFKQHPGWLAYENNCPCMNDFLVEHFGTFGTTSTRGFSKNAGVKS